MDDILSAAQPIPPPPEPIPEPPETSAQGGPPPTPTDVPDVIPTAASGKPKKKINPAVIITGILLVIAMPLAGLAVKNGTEIRSKAAFNQKDIVKLGSSRAQKEYADAENKGSTAIGQSFVNDPYSQLAIDEAKRLAAAGQSNQYILDAQIAYDAKKAQEAAGAGGTTAPTAVTTAAPVPGTTVVYGIDTCAGKDNEVGVLCNRNPPMSVTTTTNADGTKTVTTVGYTWTQGDNGQLIPDKTQTYTGITVYKNNVVTSSTINGKDTYAPYTAPNTNLNKTCGTFSRGTSDVTMQCGSGLKCEHLGASSTLTCVVDPNFKPPVINSGVSCQIITAGGILRDTCGTAGHCSGTVGFCILATTTTAGTTANPSTYPYPLPTATDINGRSICANGVRCPDGMSCDGADVPGTRGTSFESKFCTGTATTGGGTSGGGGGKKNDDGGGGAAATPTPTMQCISIRVYQDDVALSSTDLAALHVGDTVTLGYTPPAASTKVQFKVNTGAWQVTTTREGSEFRLDYTLENSTSFKIDAQWFDGSAWND